MDSTHDFDQTTFCFRIGDYDYYRGELPEYTNLTVSGIHRAVIEADIDKAKRCLATGESVNKKESQYGYSSLHLAVMRMKIEVSDENYSDLQPYVPYSNNAKMLQFLLAEKGVELDSRCFQGWTPLYLATSLDDIDTVKKLIEAGSDVNASDDENDRPLHISVYHRQICQLLLEHGAVIYTDNKWKDTMQNAIVEYCSNEVVHMLLYYNLDANVRDFHGFTPFMTALRHGRKKTQEALLEYVDDFNSINCNHYWCGSTLSYALQSNSPFVKDIIERGADVNYADYLEVMDIVCAFLACVHYNVDLGVFKLVWERLRFNDDKNTIDFLGFLNYVDKVPAYLSIIIECDNFEVAVRFFSKDDNYFLFANKYAEKELDLEQLTTLTCRLLQNGFYATSYDIGAVFCHYGCCELFRILLYMDIDLTQGWLPSMAFPRLIFDIDFNLETIIDDLEDIPKKYLIQLLEYSVCPRLIGALNLRYSEDENMRAVISGLPRVPTLIELARNPARKQIWQSFKISNTCQFYTTIDHLEIPTLYKDILTFKKKMYIIEE